MERTNVCPGLPCGYGRRLHIKMLQDRIRMDFFPLICCKNCNVWRRPEINEKEARDSRPIKNVGPTAGVGTSGYSSPSGRSNGNTKPILT